MEQHLAFTARIYQVRDYEPVAAQLLEELEIAGKKNALPGELSRGMKQKLAIACGLLHAPKVIYFDEPLTGLDPIGIRRMKDSILKRAREGAAIIISSHLLHLVEEICSHILILKDGRKIIHGTLARDHRRSSRRRRAMPASKRSSSAPPVTRSKPSRGNSAQGMNSALLYLQYHSIKNRTVMRVKRLKQPKYLLGGIVGGLYFYWYFFRALLGGPGGGKPFALFASPDNLALLEFLGALVLFIVLLLAWIIPHQRAALTFTEAEVAFLFPAPISRRTLIHFKLLRSQTAILFTTLLLTLVSNRLGGHAWIRAAGCWLILSTVNLHLLGSSFAVTMLLDRGISPWRRRLGILALAAAVAGVVIVWCRQTLPAFDLSQLGDLAAAKDYAQQVLTAGPVPYLLFPLRLIVRPFLASNALAFLAVLGPAAAAAAAALRVGRAVERRV